MISALSLLFISSCMTGPPILPGDDKLNCTNDSDCRADFECKNNYCEPIEIAQPNCTVDTDCDYGKMCQEGECVVCPLPPCGAAPPEGCQYVGGGYDERGCNYQCGDLVCDPLPPPIE